MSDGERLLGFLCRAGRRCPCSRSLSFRRRGAAGGRRSIAPGQPEPTSVTEVGGGDSCVDGHSNRTKFDVGGREPRPFLSALAACADAGGHGSAQVVHLRFDLVDALGRCADSMGGTPLVGQADAATAPSPSTMPARFHHRSGARAFERGDGNLSATVPMDQGGDSMHPNRNEFSTRLISVPLTDR